jgi:hypothetical protein
MKRFFFRLLFPSIARDLAELGKANRKLLADYGYHLEKYELVKLELHLCQGELD